jgi:acetyl esterase/lipase
MGLDRRTLELTSEQRRACDRINAILAMAPRVRPDRLTLALGQRLNAPLSALTGQISGTLLRRSGVNVTTVVTRSGVTGRKMDPVEGAHALVVDFHGGGWMVGSASLNDRVNGHLVRHGLSVASIDYRLITDDGVSGMAEAVADCREGIRWALATSDLPIFVAGESAGAHLACLAVLGLTGDERRRLAGCVFIQGVFDLAGSPSVRAATKTTLLFDGPNLSRDLGLLMPGQSEEERRRPDVSPLYAELGYVPPALFVVGELDPLRDDGVQMAERWSGEADVRLLYVPTAPHGVQHFGTPAGSLAQAEMRKWIDERLGVRVSVDDANR